MKLQDLFKDVYIVEVFYMKDETDEVSYYRLFIESSTSDMICSSVDVVKKTYEDLVDEDFYNNKKIDYSEMKVVEVNK